MNSPKILDFHARLAATPSAYEQLVASMDACGIGRAVVSAGGMIDLDLLSIQVYEGGEVTTDPDNDAVLEASHRADGRLVPFWFANPHRAPHVYAERVSEFHGLELAPVVHGIPLVDSRTEAYVQVAEEAGHPVYIGCVMRDGFTVLDLVELAKRFPDTTFVLGHLGFINIDLYAMNAVAPHSNILVETSGGYMCVVRAAIDRLGPERLLFGSEYPLQHPDVELAKFDALDLPLDVWRQIAWDNAIRLLKEVPA